MNVFDWVRQVFAGRTSMRLGVFVEHPEFDTLYMRVVVRSDVLRHLRDTSDGSLPESSTVNRSWTIVVAVVSAKVQGRGAWRRFVSELRARFPGRPILVECVHSPEFAAHLVRHGWRYVPDGPHYWLAGDDGEPYASEVK